MVSTVSTLLESGGKDRVISLGRYEWGNAEGRKELRPRKTKRRRPTLAFVPLDFNSHFGVYPIFSNVSTGWEETGSPDPPRHTVHLALTWKKQTGWSFLTLIISWCFKCYAYLCHLNFSKISFVGQFCFNILAPQYISSEQRWQMLRRGKWDWNNFFTFTQVLASKYPSRLALRISTLLIVENGAWPLSGVCIASMQFSVGCYAHLRWLERV